MRAGANLRTLFRGRSFPHVVATGLDSLFSRQGVALEPFQVASQCMTHHGTLALYHLGTVHKSYQLRGICEATYAYSGPEQPKNEA